VGAQERVDRGVAHRAVVDRDVQKARRAGQRGSERTHRHVVRRRQHDRVDFATERDHAAEHSRICVYEEGGEGGKEVKGKM